MLFGVMSMHFAAAGSLGLPLGVFGLSPLLSLLAMGTGDEDDPPLDWQDEYRLWLADTFGRETGEASPRDRCVCCSTWIWLPVSVSAICGCVRRSKRKKAEMRSSSGC